MAGSYYLLVTFFFCAEVWWVNFQLETMEWKRNGKARRFCIINGTPSIKKRKMLWIFEYDPYTDWNKWTITLKCVCISHTVLNNWCLWTEGIVCGTHPKVGEENVFLWYYGIPYRQWIVQSYKYCSQTSLAFQWNA